MLSVWPLLHSELTLWQLGPRSTLPYTLRVPQRGTHSSFNSAAFISQNHTPTQTPSPLLLPYNPITAHTTTESKQGGSLRCGPRSGGLLQPANKNRPEREGNPGPDQLLLQISMKKHRKRKHIPTTNNPSDYHRLFFLLFSLQASRLGKLGRYHKRWLLQS